MLIKHLVVCTQSLSHIHPQLYILFPPKLWEQCHQALTFAFVRYTFCFCGTGLRMFFSAPLVFPCLREKVAQYGVGEKKKVSFMEREGGAFPLWSKSADLLYLRKKNETTLLEADVDTVSVIEDGKSSLRRCSYKAVLMAVKVPVMRHLPSWRGQQKQYETQNEVSLWFQRTRNTKD